MYYFYHGSKHLESRSDYIIGESDLGPNCCMIVYPNTSFEEKADDNCRTMSQKGWTVKKPCKIQHNSNKAPFAPRKNTYESWYYETFFHYMLEETLCPDRLIDHCRVTICSLHSMLSPEAYCVPCIHNMLP